MQPKIPAKVPTAKELSLSQTSISARLVTVLAKAISEPMKGVR
jgi:hypothetical protein